MKLGRATLLAGLMTAALGCSAFGQQDDRLGKLNFPTSAIPRCRPSLNAALR